MSLAKEEILHISKLARLKFSDSEVEIIQHELNEILGYIDMLNEVNTENIEALSQINKNVNNLRSDVIRQSLSVEEVMSNAPESDEGAIIVPKVVGE
ncbi:Asp-tRNA(Asn)/Glu-tRNA(Gln) amidotransferase subunit GatC [Fusobacterium sp. PH5-44]|uniref:Asp-tRNA(Asn)/Glu-tRNA(Gln) amidotransferase subunit GatC n=1 Tax=unclassified Fusobacterium TaxID=2648384 RepID=UPI003D1ABD57